MGVARFNRDFPHRSVNTDTPDAVIPGSDGMTGSMRSGIITVTGPCGQAHSMSVHAALALSLWLTQHAMTAVAPDAVFKIIDAEDF